MTFKYNNVYINNTAMVVGPYEGKGPLKNTFDKIYDDLYFGTDNWESAESKLIEDSVSILLNKINGSKEDINIHISGDLLNQLVASNFASSNLSIPLLGIYSACASSMEGIIIGASLIEANLVKNCICSVSSHNNSVEKQFRYPIEYGGPRPKTATFTTTGGASCYMSYNKNGIKVESGTIGKVVDYDIKDPYHMGAAMAPAAASVLIDHLKDTKREVNYYDLILTGDLGVYGKELFKQYLLEEKNFELSNYDDCGTTIFDLNKQPVYAGGSGTACAPLVTYGYIFNKMKKRDLRKVLVIATGALLSTTTVNQKKGIPCIAHAVSLEVIE